MQITLVQGLLIALLVFICAIDKHMEPLCGSARWS